MMSVELTMRTLPWPTILCALSILLPRAAPIPCPWGPMNGCRGPYVIRPARHTSGAFGDTCSVDRETEMIACLHQCVDDICCRAFGLDPASGECVVDLTGSETMNFVIETEEPLPGLCTSSSHAIVSELSVVMSDYFNYGKWWTLDVCPVGSYAAGIQLKIENLFDSVIDGDTGLNAIRLFCKSARYLTHTATLLSREGDYGTWKAKLYCPHNYWIDDFQVLYTPDRWGLDDTGADGLRVRCRGPGLAGTNTAFLEDSNTRSTSQWSGWAGGCPSGTAVCALQSRVFFDTSFFPDQVGLTDAKMKCCDF